MYVGRPETDWARRYAMSVLGGGLFDANYHEDALSVYEARLSLMRRLGEPLENMLMVQGNLASIYSILGRDEAAVRLRREVYSGTLKLCGEQHESTLREANNYVVFLLTLDRHAEAKTLLRTSIANARRTLGAEHDLTLNFRNLYARCLCDDPSASRDDVAEAIEIFEDVQRRARRVFGPGHPNWKALPRELMAAREKLASFDT